MNNLINKITFRSKNSILFVILVGFLLSLILILFNFDFSINEYLKNVKEKNIDWRSVLVDTDDLNNIEKFKSIDHVTQVTDINFFIYGFFIDKSQVYKNDQLNYFAVNLGGEILRWSLKAMDRDLYKEEPYKRLWIMGTPCVITFKVKLDDIYETDRNSLIAEIVKYNIMKDIFGFDYEFKFTGMTVGDVPPENILSIEEIRDYIHMQEKYPDYKGFYDELKSDFK